MGLSGVGVGILCDFFCLPRGFGVGLREIQQKDADPDLAFRSGAKYVGFRFAQPDLWGILETDVFLFSGLLGGAKCPGALGEMEPVESISCLQKKRPFPSLERAVFSSLCFNCLTK